VTSREHRHSFVVVVAGNSRTRAPKTSVDARTRTAYHEAGHAVLSAAISDMPQHVSIRPEGNTLGRAAARRSVLPAARVQVHLAGFAAEHLLTGRRPRQLGKEVGFAILARLDPALRSSFTGCEDFDGHRAVEDALSMNTREGDDQVRREIDRYFEVARESLSAVWPAVQRVAKALLELEELDLDGVAEAIGNVDIFSPVFAVQRVHGLLPEVTVAAK
jgi:ATP-dependent Zn protease